MADYSGAEVSCTCVCDKCENQGYHYTLQCHVRPNWKGAKKSPAVHRVFADTYKDEARRGRGKLELDI